MGRNTALYSSPQAERNRRQDAQSVNSLFPPSSRAKLPNKAIPQGGSRLLPQLTLKLEKQNPLLPPPTDGNASFSSPQQARETCLLPALPPAPKASLVSQPVLLRQVCTRESEQGAQHKRSAGEERLRDLL